MDDYERELRALIVDLEAFKEYVAVREHWRIDNFIDQVRSGIMSGYIALEYAQQMALRNAEFDGDWVGRPDDAFDDDDFEDPYFR